MQAWLVICQHLQQCPLKCRYWEDLHWGKLGRLLLGPEEAEWDRARAHLQWLTVKNALGTPHTLQVVVHTDWCHRPTLACVGAIQGEAQAAGIQFTELQDSDPVSPVLLGLEVEEVD